MTTRDAAPPPPSPALLDAIAGIHPVATRKPRRTLAALSALAVVSTLLTLMLRPLRADLAHLPPAWVVIMALAWTGAVALLLARAVLPPRGHVLPDPARALRSAVQATSVLVALGLLATVDAPGHTLTAPAGEAGVRIVHCLALALALALPLLVGATFALRRLFPSGAARVAATLGAGAGAVGGLTLHFLCAYGGGLHVGVGHGGAMVLVGLLAAAALSRTMRS